MKLLKRSGRSPNNFSIQNQYILQHGGDENNENRQVEDIVLILRTNNKLDVWRIDISLMGLKLSEERKVLPLFGCTGAVL